MGPPCKGISNTSHNKAERYDSIFNNGLFIQPFHLFLQTSNFFCFLNLVISLYHARIHMKAELLLILCNRSIFIHRFLLAKKTFLTTAIDPDWTRLLSFSDEIPSRKFRRRVCERALRIRAGSTLMNRIKETISSESKSSIVFPLGLRAKICSSSASSCLLIDFKRAVHKNEKKQVEREGQCPSPPKKGRKRER